MKYYLKNKTDGSCVIEYEGSDITSLAEALELQEKLGEDKFDIYNENGLVEFGDGNEGFGAI